MKPPTPQNELNTHRPLPPILYKPAQTIIKTLAENLDSLKANIKTQPGERDSDMIVIYMPMFWTGSTEDLLKFVMISNKIIRVQDIYTGSHKFGMTSNLIDGEALRFLEKNYQDRVRETNANYELLMKDVISHFSPLKDIRRQKRYLQMGLYKR